ncbi:MAG: hypothetical protein KAT25_05225 [Sulfuriflexus sp.]|nr:hypothetical protein [Sulfuriflexus sp.]
MKNSIAQLNIILLPLLLILLPAICVADVFTDQLAHNGTEVVIEGEYIADEELSSMRGTGDEGAQLVIPGSVSVILWDETNGTKNNTRYEKTDGTNNTQKTHVNLIPVNVTR